MTGSRNSLPAIALALSALLMAPAAAQWSADKPPVLGPEDYPPVADEEDTNRPVDSTAAPQSAAQDGEAAPEGSQSENASGAPRPLQNNDVVTPPPPPDQSVEVGTLGSAEGPPAGLLDPASGGLDADIWSGSERARILDLLARAPLVSADPAMRAAVERIVLTKAAAPAGTAKRSFVAARIDKLLDAGLVEEAGALAAGAAVPNDADFVRVQVRALLTANRSGDVCGDKTASRLTSDDVFWMQLRAYCAAVGGDKPAADLTLAVLQAQGNADAAFDTLLEDVLNRYGVAPGPIAHPTAMHVYLFRQAGLPLPDGVARMMGTPENLLVMRDTRNLPHDRFAAAGRIAATGAATVNELKAVADAQDLPLSRVAGAAAEAPDLPFFEGQTLLRRAAVIEPRPDVKARLADEALSLGRKFGLLPLASAVQADVIANLKPSPGNLPMARDFAQALLLAGQPEAAARWTGGDTVMQTIAAIASRDPARLVVVQANLAAFATSLTKDPPDPDPDRSYKALLLGLADVLGLPMPPETRAVAVSVESRTWDGKRPGPGLMRSIQEVALRPERRGEALLMVLDTIDELGCQTMAPDVTIELVRILANMNEQDTARAIALDAMAQYVPPPTPPPAAPAP